MQGMAERCHVDDERLRAIGDTFGWPRQPGCFPRWKQKQQFRIGGPRGRPEQQRDDFGFTVELRIQFGVPCGFGLQGEGDRKLSGYRAMTGYQECGNARLLPGRHATCRIERTKKCAHGDAACAGMARRWSYPRGKGMSGSPGSSGAIHTVRSPFHFFARISSANLESRSAVNAGFSSVKA